MLRGRADKRGRGPSGPAPQAPPGARNLVIVTLDSCRYDSWLSAAPVSLGALGPVERRWSYAPWTAPSHFNLLMGLLPHTSPSGVYASEYYKEDFLRYRDRLGIDGIDWARMLPSLYLPTFLHSVGYSTHALVSLPVLNPATLINHDFDTYELMPTHNDMAAMVDRLRFEPDRPSFWLLNVGETHYPYAVPTEERGAWPRVTGVHGMLKDLDTAELDTATAGVPASLFTPSELRTLQDRQIEAVGYLDGVFATLYDRLPADTWLIVTADHGELFGEAGYFGHGPINHDKVLEVPFVEGPVPR